MRVLVVSLMALLLSAGEARAASGPRRVEGATAGLTLTDGDRYAAWIRGLFVRVLDERTSTVTSHPLPEDCRPPDALGDGRAAAICGARIKPKEIRLMDLKTGVWTQVPSAGFAARVAKAIALRVGEVGRVWLSVWVEDVADQWNPVWIKRVSGRAVSDVPADRALYANADAPHLWLRLCAPLQRRDEPRVFEPGRWGSPYMPVVSERRGVDIVKRSLVLRACGSPRAKVLTRSPWWIAAFSAGSRVSWIEDGPSRVFHGNTAGHGWVRTYDARTDRRHRWLVPGRPTNDMSVVHTRKHLFLDKVWDDLVSYSVERYVIDL
jgi:hypothetical protein